MSLDLDISLKNNLKSEVEIEKFVKDLTNILENDSILVYRNYDRTKFTRENEEKLWDKKEELISENITNNNIENAEENKLYEVSNKTSNGWSGIEFDGEYSNRKTILIDKKELPENVERGMFFRKVDGKYILDKGTTEKIYNEMTSFENKLIAEQKEVLNNMRQEGAIYKVTYLEDDCEDWRTELTNIDTGETFQELEFPHEIYHYVGVGSLVRYENRGYSVVEGTSVYDLYPDVIENYCETEGVYITKDNKYKTADDLYASLNKNSVNSKNETLSRFKGIIENLVKFAVDKLVETIKNKILQR